MRIMSQFAVITAVGMAGFALSELIGAPVPGSIMSMLLLFILMMANIVKMRHVDRTADFLLRNMAVFFVPPTVTIIDHIDLVSGQATAFVGVCVGATLLTFAATVYTVRITMWIGTKLSGRKES